MLLGVDASNISGGGGITHLKHVLGAAQPSLHGFRGVVVWATPKTLDQLRDAPWLTKRAVLASTPLKRALWQRRELGRLARAEGCDLLFVPGGTILTDFRPVVTMSRNMLPFEWQELSRYGWSFTFFRLFALRLAQSRSYRKADATIFLNQHAKGAVLQVAGALRGASPIIPHGVDADVFRSGCAEEPAPSDRPIRVLYVSIIDLYKHQWHVAEAVAQLRSQGLPVSLTLIGPAYGPALRRLNNTIAQFDPRGEFLSYVGPVPHYQLPRYYAASDIFAFASSCENMPNILLEAMASCMPIACSNRGPMPEVLGDAGMYFDPESAQSIAAAIRTLAESPALRAQKGRAAWLRAGNYSWDRCARETFEFLASVAKQRRVA